MQDPNSFSNPNPGGHPGPSPQSSFGDPELVNGGQSEQSSSQPPRQSFRSGLEDKLPPQAQTFIQQYVDTARGVVLTPRLFFDTMPQTGGLKEPAMFMLAGVAVYSVMNALVTFQLLSIPMTLLVGVVVRFAIAGVAFGAAKAMGVKDARFEGLFRVVAYASCLSLVEWIPLLGQGAAFIYGCVLYYFGYQKVLQTDKGKTLGVVFASIIFSGLLLFAVMLINMLGQIGGMLFGH